MSDDDHKREGGRRGVGILISIPLLLLFYVVSIVPVVVGLMVLPDEVAHFLEKPFEVFYAPVIWLIENNKTVETWMMKLFDWMKP